VTRDGGGGGPAAATDDRFSATDNRHNFSFCDGVVYQQLRSCVVCC
jgi:hypothetical protein